MVLDRVLAVDLDEMADRSLRGITTRSCDLL